MILPQLPQLPGIEGLANLDFANFDIGNFDVANRSLAAAILVALLAVGSLCGRGLVLHQWGIPEALIAGALGLLLAPDGPLPLIPVAVIQLWGQLPLILLTLVFATLLLGKPLPKPAGLWRPLSAQVLLALTLAFGQYLVAGLAVLLVLQPLFGGHPLMACLIEVAYEGGHGSAAAMGPSYARLGFPGGEALGLAMATVGLLASTLVGGLVVILGRRRGWLTPPPPIPPAPAQASNATFSGSASSSASGSAAAASRSPGAAWAINLGLAGLAVALGGALLAILQALAGLIGGGFAAVIEALPLFPLAIIGSLLVRFVLERSGRAHLAQQAIQGRVGTLSADLLITSATACLDLSLLGRNWLPLTLLALAGLGWNLLVILLLAPRILPPDWFERALIEFGQATGVAASGLLLLRMADPQDLSDALPAFSIKQLLLQPLLAGGVITVVAPLAISGWGLPLWTALSLIVVLVSAGLGLLLASRAVATP
ncbi:MAG: sodium:solute symporter [Prochlorococcaceae cyanobacterium]